LIDKAQKFSSGTGSPGLSWKKGRKTVLAVVTYMNAGCSGLVAAWLSVAWEAAGSCVLRCTALGMGCTPLLYCL